ncbi:MAG: nitrogenase iron protein NifH [Gammaproteobacteria bacterium]|nr:nitrogenase iron protein NifH [Gammaproteobacteria bacterium]
MRQIAVYGKGGIGKSMISSHISFAFASNGLRVLHLGCDPKHDSTRLLLGGQMPHAILDVLREVGFMTQRVKLDDVIYSSPLNDSVPGMLFGAESGGPVPGSGCAGKGVTEAIHTLSQLHVADELELDAMLYDVLGDVVCGGFTMPLKRGYAKEVYIVTSGELPAMFAACNISKAVARFAQRSGVRLGGIVGNLRNMANEREILNRFAQQLGTQIVGFVPYSEKIKAASGRGETLFQYAPDSPECDAMRQLADNIYNNESMDVPEPMTFDELHHWWQANKAA